MGSDRRTSGRVIESYRLGHFTWDKPQEHRAAGAGAARALNIFCLEWIFFKFQFNVSRLITHS